jgi:biotin synthase
VGPKQFERVLDMVSRIRALGMEVCTTLGMLTKEQVSVGHPMHLIHLTLLTLLMLLSRVGTPAEARRAELLQPQRGHEPRVLPQDHELAHVRGPPRHHRQGAETGLTLTLTLTRNLRLTEGATQVREAGIGVCSGGIIGLGEKDDDRIGLLHTLATLPEHPESVPINALVAVEGTPLHKQGIKGPTGMEMVRCVATARILMPKSNVRLSAGRMDMSMAEQGMCFMAGANSIFAGDKLLTTPNAERDADAEMFQVLATETPCPHPCIPNLIPDP